TLVPTEIPDAEDEGGDFGKLGTVGVALEFGPASMRHNNGSATPKKYSGLLYGAHLRGEIWATRQFWAGLDLNRRFGVLKLKEGSATTQSPSTSNGHYKVKFGYKYLPMG